MLCYSPSTEQESNDSEDHKYKLSTKFNALCICLYALRCPVSALCVFKPSSPVPRHSCFLRYTIVNREWVDEVDVDRVQEVKKRFLRLHGVLSIQDFICGWFHGAPYDQIHRGNVLDFVAYGFYSKQPRDLSPKVGAPVSASAKQQIL